MIFVFLIPLQKRIEFYNNQTFQFGTFIDYTTPVFYVVDSTFIAALLFLVISPLLKKQNPFKIFKNRYTLFLAVFFVSLLPSLFQKHDAVSLTTLLHVAIAILFSAIISVLAQSKRFAELLLLALSLSGVYQSVIGILQFLFQRSLGLTYLGESPFNVFSLNVAKIVESGDTYIRAYGTFPHPNVFASFLAVSLSATLSYFFLKREKILSNIFQTLIFLLAFLAQFTALLFTFSRTGWLIALIMLAGIVGYILYANEKHEADLNIKIKLRTLALLLACIIAGILFLAKPFLLARATVSDSNGDHAISERVLLIDVSRETISKNIFLGTGLRSFTSDITTFASKHQVTLEGWQYQPVHNIYLLIFTENGLLGILGFVVLLGFVFTSSIKGLANQKTTQARALSLFPLVAIGGFLLLGFLDHHPLDIHQSLLTFFMMLGLSYGTSQS